MVYHSGPVVSTLKTIKFNIASTLMVFSQAGTPLHNMLKKFGSTWYQFCMRHEQSGGDMSLTKLCNNHPHNATCLSPLVDASCIFMNQRLGFGSAYLTKLLWFSEIKIKMCLLSGRCSALSCISLSFALKHAEASYGKLFITTASTTISFFIIS